MVSFWQCLDIKGQVPLCDKLYDYLNTWKFIFKNSLFWKLKRINDTSIGRFNGINFKLNLNVIDIGLRSINANIKCKPYLTQWAIALNH